MKWGRIFIWPGAILLLGCLDTYTPPPNLQSSDGMVVDGFLDATSRSARVVLSHTTQLDSAGPPEPESGATVSIQSDRGDALLLTESSAGVYEQSDLLIDMQARYQLHIVTSDGLEYTSEYVDVHEAPPIDHLSVDYDGEGVWFRVSAHDPAGDTRYYRWDYTETWEYTAPFRSDYALINKQPTPRPPGQGVYRCWRSARSSNIMIGTSTRLSEDVISNLPIFHIPTGDQRLSIRYSVLVEQRAASRSEYDYLVQLRQSTEMLGGLFDRQPSQVRGNVTSNNPQALVLGYFSAGTTTTKRLFQSFDDLPESHRVLPSKGACAQDTVCVTIPNEWNLNCSIELKELSGTELITGSLFRDFAVIGFLKTTAECGDCRAQGGSTSPPDFW